MTMRLVGVALAAVMTCAGVGAGVQQAQASMINFNGEHELGQFGASYGIVKLDGDSSYVSFVKQNDFDFGQQDQQIVYSFVSHKVGRFEILSNGRATYTVDGDYSINSGLGSGPMVITFYAFDDFYINRETQVYSATFNEPRDEVGDYSDGSGSVLVSSVPLPASAPLLGAALLALGGAGYARRRMMQA